jgi:hypothetical protein
MQFPYWLDVSYVVVFTTDSGLEYIKLGFLKLFEGVGVGSKLSSWLKNAEQGSSDLMSSFSLNCFEFVDLPRLSLTENSYEGRYGFC